VSAAAAKNAGVKNIPQVDAANEIGAMIQALRKNRDQLDAVITKAEGMHDALAKQAQLLTSAGADAMAASRECADALELRVPDEQWPLPKYREMLFPV
jgi:glutamine synthetase